ncbi:RES family NAD+ phosphorylase [Acerihabitans arboris]|uniref:RES domain-containing protein n=1 Tax=Acerihabitans arboris TaxID=2691583 RepID=A0A845SKT3_9GAMM|nr:RES family NAD+ phosphorylase [Acerihabitans arboris]NDL63857.1 RES domain-containing protein [Acerihabitans arboris]
MMLNLNEGNHNRNTNTLIDLVNDINPSVMINLPVGLVLFHVQKGYFSGSGVFFNKQTGTKISRFAVGTGTKGTYYVAYAPETALAEVFKDAYLEAEDLDRYFMATVSPVRSLKIVHMGYLARELGIDVTALMNESYATTQKIAAEVSHYADGLWYISRKLGEPCLAFWHECTDGAGLFITRDVVALSRFHYQNIDAESMLDRLNIKVM